MSALQPDAFAAPLPSWVRELTSLGYTVLIWKMQSVALEDEVSSQILRLAHSVAVTVPLIAIQLSVLC